MVHFFRTLLFHALPATYGPLPSCNGVVVIGSFIFFMKDFPPSAAVPKVVRNLREPWGQLTMRPLPGMVRRFQESKVSKAVRKFLVLMSESHCKGMDSPPQNTLLPPLGTQAPLKTRGLAGQNGWPPEETGEPVNAYPAMAVSGGR